jgi:hypothetical protein
MTSGNTPLSSDSGLILTFESASASIEWNRDAAPLSRAQRRSAAEIQRKRLRNDAAGTYIDELLSTGDSTLARWQVSPGRTIKVWVSVGSGDTTTTRYHSEIQSAFFEWQRAGVPIQFGFVRDSTAADLHVLWKDGFQESVGGRSDWVHDQDGWMVRGVITLSLFAGNGERMSLTAMRALALHEVGHLIGLGHTADSLSIMSPVVRVTSLSHADRATALLLYKLRPGVLKDAP